MLFPARQQKNLKIRLCRCYKDALQRRIKCSKKETCGTAKLLRLNRRATVILFAMDKIIQFAARRSTALERRRFAAEPALRQGDHAHSKYALPEPQCRSGGVLGEAAGLYALRLRLLSLPAQKRANGGVIIPNTSQNPMGG